MSKTMKKVLATLSAGAIVAMNSMYFVSAAALNNTTGVVDANSFTITGADAAAFDSATSATVTVSKDGVAVTAFDSVVVNQGTPDTIVITKAGAFGNGYYVVSFQTDNGIFGTTTLDQTSTFNEVVVSARVVPILTMSLSSNTIDLGELTPAAMNNDTNTLSIATNANAGYTVQAKSLNSNASAGLYDSVGLTEIPATAVPSTNLAAGTSAFGIKASVADGAGAGTPAVDEAFDADDTADAAISTSYANLVTSNGVSAGDTITVTYQAAVSAIQEAGSYATTISYTVTGTF